MWDLEIGPGPRTADVVFLVTQPRTAQPAAPPAPAPSPNSPPPAGTPAPSRTPPPPAAATAPSTSPPPPAIELRQTVGPVKAVFQAFRTRSGIVLRYEITNGSDGDLILKPTMILVRADGRPVAYGMARDSVDRGRPDIVPRGATETGVIDLATPSARQVELALSLVPVAPASPAQAPPAAPAARAATAPSALIPIVLQATFSGLDRLPISPAP